LIRWSFRSSGGPALRAFVRHHHGSFAATTLELDTPADVPDEQTSARAAQIIAVSPAGRLTAVVALAEGRFL
jgi:hypothetical protein